MGGIKHLISQFEVDDPHYKSKEEDLSSEIHSMTGSLSPSFSTAGDVAKKRDEKSMSSNSHIWRRTIRRSRKNSSASSDSKEALSQTSESSEEKDDLFLASAFQEGRVSKGARPMSAIAIKTSSSVRKHRKAVSTIIEVDNDLVALCEPRHETVVRSAKGTSKEHALVDAESHNAANVCGTQSPEGNSAHHIKKEEPKRTNNEAKPPHRSDSLAGTTSMNKIKKMDGTKMMNGLIRDEDVSIPPRRSKIMEIPSVWTDKYAVKGLNITLRGDTKSEENEQSLYNSPKGDTDNDFKVKVLQRSPEYIHSRVPRRASTSMRDICNSSVVSVGSDVVEGGSTENHWVSRMVSSKSSATIDESEEAHNFYGVRLSHEGSFPEKMMKNGACRGSISRQSVLTSTESNLALPSPASKNDLFDTPENISSPTTPIENLKLPFGEKKKVRPVSAFLPLESECRKSRSSSSHLEPSIHFSQGSRHSIHRITPSERESDDYFSSHHTQTFGTPKLHSSNVVTSLEDTIGPDSSMGQFKGEKDSAWKRAIGKLFGKSKHKDENPVKELSTPKIELPGNSSHSGLARSHSKSKRPVSFVSSLGSSSTDKRRISVERVHDFRVTRTPESPSYGKKDFIPSRAAPTPRPASVYTPSNPSISRSSSVRKSKNSTSGLQMHPQVLFDSPERLITTPISEVPISRTPSKSKRLSTGKTALRLFSKDKSIDRRSISSPVLQSGL